MGCVVCAVDGSPCLHSLPCPLLRHRRPSPGGGRSPPYGPHRPPREGVYTQPTTTTERQRQVRSGQSKKEKEQKDRSGLLRYGAAGDRSG